MDGHWVVLFIMQLIYTIPIIAAIVGAIALPIAGLVLRKSKPQLSKKLLIIGGSFVKKNKTFAPINKPIPL